MRRALQRAGRLFRRVADWFPLTPLGLLVGLAAWGTLEWLAYGKMDLVQLVVGYGALGLGALAVLAVLLAAAGVGLAARPVGRREPLWLETTRPFPTDFSLPSLRWLPLIQLRWEWDSPGGLSAHVEQKLRAGRLHEEVTVADRGEIRGIVRRIVLQDAFGLVRLAVRKRDPLVLRAVPHAGALGTMPVLQSFAGGDEHPHPMGLEDGDRTELRRYAPGDPARFIHWKVFGRTRKLVVRMPERALSRARRVVAYQVAGVQDDATAGAARVAIRTGALGGQWTFCADGADEDARTVPEALELVVRSVEARGRGATGLRDFLRRAEREGPAAVVVFAPPRPGPWLARVAEVARARQGRMRVVIAVDGLRPGGGVPWWLRLTTVRREEPGASLPELEEVLRVLEGSGCDVVLLDRPTGTLLGRAHRAAVARRARGGGPGRPAPEIGERHAA